MCEVPPTPPNACLTFGPSFFAHSTNSLTFFAGIDALIAMAAGAFAVMPIGSKSLVESYFRFG